MLFVGSWFGPGPTPCRACGFVWRMSRLILIFDWPSACRGQDGNVQEEALHLITFKQYAGMLSLDLDDSKRELREAGDTVGSALMLVVCLDPRSPPGSRGWIVLLLLKWADSERAERKGLLSNLCISWDEKHLGLLPKVQ